jgi:cell division protein FtsQ
MSPSTVLGSRRPGPPAPSPAAPPPRQRRRWVLPLVASVLVLVLAAVGWLVWFSPVLATEQVSVSGTSTLTKAEVQDAAQVPIGRPLARQDVDAVAARVSALRPVRAVQVTRSWPRTVSIAVQERTPRLAVRQPDGFALVDDSGISYRTVSSRPKDVVLAEVDVTNAAMLSRAGQVAAAMPEALRKKVARIAATNSDSIQVTLSDGDEVFWGSADESELKAKVLTALLKQDARRYDVSAPRSPSLR